MWTPTHVVVTVTKARNLLEKGKGGNDAYCMIGMGKEKFLTSVKSKTLCPVWDEQAEFELGEREDLKITVYHKSSIIDEFVGRVVINVPELATQDNNHSYITWYKLGGKPEKSEKSKKPEKERGEIEVRVDFIIKPKAGSMMDLSLKNKEKSLSLRNLKEKMSNKKGSFSDKLKFKKQGQPKYAGENQLAEQAKRMGGSKLDFLDGDDIGSIASSYSSINGPTLSRGNSGQINSMSRFNPNRQSYVSRTSSRQENDSSSIYGNDASRNEEEEDFNDYFKNDGNESSENDRDSANGSSFQRRGSSRFGSTLSRVSISRRPPSNKSNTTTETTNVQDESAENAGSIHIAPLLPFNNGTSTPQSTPRNGSHHETKVSEKKTRHKTSSSIVATIDEENILSVKSPTRSPAKSPVEKPDPSAALDSFASIFTASLNNDSNPNEKKIEHTDSRSTITDSLYDKSQSSVNESSTASSQSKQKSKAPVADIKQQTPPSNKKLISNNPFLSIEESPSTKTDLTKASSNPFLDDEQEVTSARSTHHKKQAPIIPVITKNAKNINNFPMAHDDYEDNIEWDSSEDEEIVKKEVASFERNQIMRQSERRRLVPVEDLTSDLNSETDFNHSTCSIASSARNKNVQKPLSNRNTMQLDLKSDSNYNNRRADSSDDIKTPDFDDAFQDHINDKNKLNSTHGSVHNSGLPDLINQKGNKDVPTDKARKYLEGLDGVKFNEIQVPDSLKKQLEYFDRDELLQLIAYQKKYLDFKEGRIKDLENYIDNLVVKIIETEPLILMNASNVLSKGRNLI